MNARALIHASVYLGRDLEQARNLVLINGGQTPGDASLCYCVQRKAFYLRTPYLEPLKTLSAEALGSSVPVGDVLALPDVRGFAGFLPALPMPSQPVSAFSEEDFHAARRILNAPPMNLRRQDSRADRPFCRALLKVSEDAAVVYAITGHNYPPARSSWHYFAPNTEWLAQKFVSAHRAFGSLDTLAEHIQMPEQMYEHVGATGVPTLDSERRLFHFLWEKVCMRRPNAAEHHNWLTIYLAVAVCYFVASRCQGHLGTKSWDAITGAFLKQEKDRGHRYQECIAYLAPQLNALLKRYLRTLDHILEANGLRRNPDSFYFYVYVNDRLQPLTVRIVNRAIRHVFPLGLRALRKSVRTYSALEGRHGEAVNMLLGQCAAGGHLSHRFSTSSYDILRELSAAVEAHMLSQGWKWLT